MSVVGQARNDAERDADRHGYRSQPLADIDRVHRVIPSEFRFALRSLVAACCRMMNLGMSFARRSITYRRLP
jgi:hypothetical protein